MTIKGQLWIDSQWRTGHDKPFSSTNPADGETVWEGVAASEADVRLAVEKARAGQSAWWETPVEQRIEKMLQFAEQVRGRQEELAELISRENGKPLWEAKTEVNAVIGKEQLAINAFRERRDTSRFEMNGLEAVTRYKPHGVLGVLGPFNLPAHLPNGHIVPSLIAGNAVVFKPSEQTPAVGEWLAQQWEQVGLPAGVVNLVQGGRETGIALANEKQLDGLLFTGSGEAGLALHRAYAGSPQKILALEMGGNNPLVAHEVSDSAAAAYTTLLSAYITAGQRCTCARRLILVNGAEADELVSELERLLSKLQTGYWNDDPAPFHGPVIDKMSGTGILQKQQALIDRGATVLRPAQSLRDNPALLQPGLLDVTDVDQREDREIFGPLLQIIRVNSFDDAIAEANNTAYGLSAGLLSDRKANYDRFIQRIRAGIVNWNRQTTGASGRLPFGGWGLSGNHRPSGYFAADYCNWPVASLESDKLQRPDETLPGINL